MLQSKLKHLITSLGGGQNVAESCLFIIVLWTCFFPGFEPRNPNFESHPYSTSNHSFDLFQILLWDTDTWKLVDRLPGHSLTVIQMEFSPCDGYLLTASRDRTWCLFSRRNPENRFVRIANTDKNTAVHQRLIW